MDDQTVKSGVRSDLVVKKGINAWKMTFGVIPGWEFVTHTIGGNSHTFATRSSSHLFAVTTVMWLPPEWHRTSKSLRTGHRIFEQGSVRSTPRRSDFSQTHSALGGCWPITSMPNAATSSPLLPRLPPQTLAFLRFQTAVSIGGCASRLPWCVTFETHTDGLHGNSPSLMDNAQ